MSFVQKLEYVYYERMWSRSARDSLYYLKKALGWGILLVAAPIFICEAGAAASYESWVFVGTILRYICTPVAALLFLYTFIPLVYLVRRFLKLWYKEDEQERHYRMMLELHKDDEEDY